jgi:hypothetical protein
MTKTYSVKIIIESSYDLSPFHAQETQILQPILKTYTKTEAIKAAMRTLQIMLDDETPPCDIEQKSISFTPQQEDFICYQIGEWYLRWKISIANFKEGTHRLGFAKEQLKEMICGRGDDL